MLFTGRGERSVQRGLMILLRLRRELRSLIADERGSYLAFMAIIMSVILSFSAMGLDVAMWYQEKRITQNIADVAAVAAAHVSQRGGDLSEMTAAALAEAVRNGFVAGPDNQVAVTASSGPPVGITTPVVDVTVRRAVPLLLMSLFRDDRQIIAAHATGGHRQLGNICVIGLDYPKPDNVTSRNVEFIGNTYANVACGVHSNATTTDSLYIGGNATLLANPAQAVGEILVSGSGSLTVTGGEGSPIPYANYVDDPFEGRYFPVSPVACDSGDLVVSSDLMIDPPGGSFKICGDLRVQPGVTLTLGAGVYYVEDGDILFQGTVDGTAGVTIVLTGTTPSSVGEIDIRAQATVTLTAPNTGDYQGIAIMQDPDADTTGDNKFNGGSQLIVSGGIYLKNQQATYNGGTDSDGCTLIVARMVKFSGNTTTYIRNTPGVCDSVGLGDGLVPAQTQVVLVQ